MHKKRIFFLLLILISLYLPDHSYSLPVIKLDSQGAADTNLKFQEENETIHEILMELIEARGFMPEEGVPKTRVDSTELGNSPAGMSLKTNQLFIHPRTIELCKKFGEDYEDALAAIIGHELVHFYQRRKCRFTPWLQGKDSLEYEADLQGLFNVYLAGYKIKGTGPLTLHGELTEKIYTAFDLAENPSYPTRAERRVMAHKTEQTVKQLASLFEMANYAILCGHFQHAIALNDYLLDNINAREFHNNIAIAYASLYKQLNGDGHTYPFEINTDSRLYHPVRSEDIGVGEESIRTKAMEHFCLGVGNSYELDIFEIALAIIGGDYALAKKKILVFPKEECPLKIAQLKKILHKKKGGMEQICLVPNSATVPPACRVKLKYLDDYRPSIPLSDQLFALFEPEQGVTAIRLGDMRFVVQSFVPTCSKLISEEPVYTVPHSDGVFHLFTKEGVILTEKQGEITKGAKVWPNFIQ